MSRQFYGEIWQASLFDSYINAFKHYALNSCIPVGKAGLLKRKEQSVFTSVEIIKYTAALKSPFIERFYL